MGRGRVILVAGIAATASDGFGKIFKFNDLKNFCYRKNRPLEIKRRSPKSLCRRAPVGLDNAGAGGVRRPFVSVLLNGGCGYEEPKPRPLLAD